MYYIVKSFYFDEMQNNKIFIFQANFGPILCDEFQKLSS